MRLISLPEREWEWLHFEPTYLAARNALYSVDSTLRREGWRISYSSNAGITAVSPDGIRLRIAGPGLDPLGLRPDRVTASAHWLREATGRNYEEVEWLTARVGISLEIAEDLSALLARGLATAS